MENPISDYQKWKQQGASLRAKAKQAMESRYRDLLLEAVQIAHEYHADFGGSLKPPAGVTAFRFKSGARKAARPAAAPKVTPGKMDPKVAALQKSLAVTNKKLEAAKAVGKPTKNLEDRVYEIEDAIRLAGG